MRNVRGKKGCKPFYFGSPRSQYGVGYTITESFRHNIKEVEWFDARMILTRISADFMVYFFTTGNERDERVVDFADSYDFVLVNTYVVY